MRRSFQRSVTLASVPVTNRRVSGSRVVFAWLFRSKAAHLGPSRSPGECIDNDHRNASIVDVFLHVEAFHRSARLPLRLLFRLRFRRIRSHLAGFRLRFSCGSWRDFSIVESTHGHAHQLLVRVRHRSTHALVADEVRFTNRLGFVSGSNPKPSGFERKQTRIEFPFDWKHRPIEPEGHRRRAERSRWAIEISRDVSRSWACSEGPRSDRCLGSC